jgi:4-amino-4-deoxy-L-arabinose transferase-like glycosyltransferase
MIAARYSDALTKSETILVHFGARVERMELRRETARACVVIGAVMLIAGALMLFRLGSAEICSSNEAVEGLVVQEMVAHGALLFPVTNEHATMYKPPLFHWTAAAIAHVLGLHEATELTLRLPSVLFALSCLLLTMLFVASWLGLPSAVLAGLVLLGSFQYVSEARFGRVDMALTFCESLSIFAFAWWLRGRDVGAGARRATGAARRAQPALYVFAVALALGVLAKGPVGMLLPLSTAVAVLLSERRWSDVRALASPGPLIVLLLVSSGWYLVCLWGRRLDVLHLQILDENFRRFMGGIRTMAPWYYMKPLLLNSAPLSMLVPFAVFRALRSASSRGERRDGAADRDLRPFVLGVFWVLTVAFFSVAAYKRRAYLLPLWPAAAVLLVWWFDTWRNDRDRQLAKGALATACGGLILFNLGYVPYAERAACGAARYREAAATINAVVPRNEPLYLDAASTASTSLLFYLDRSVPALSGALADAPRGYVLVPERTWGARPVTATLRPLLAVTLERQRLILLQSRPLGDEGSASSASNSTEDFAWNGR